jgi:hypothetical protein
MVNRWVLLVVIVMLMTTIRVPLTLRAVRDRVRCPRTVMLLIGEVNRGVEESHSQGEHDEPQSKRSRLRISAGSVSGAGHGEGLARSPNIPIGWLEDLVEVLLDPASSEHCWVPAVAAPEAMLTLPRCVCLGYPPRLSASSSAPYAIRFSALAALRLISEGPAFLSQNVGEKRALGRPPHQGWCPG